MCIQKPEATFTIQRSSQVWPVALKSSIAERVLVCRDRRQPSTSLTNSDSLRDHQSWYLYPPMDRDGDGFLLGARQPGGAGVSRHLDQSRVGEKGAVSTGVRDV